MSPSNRATNNPGDDERLAAELERLDDSLGSGCTETPPPAANADAVTSDPKLSGAADVLRMIRRVRSFEEQSLSSIRSAAMQKSSPESMDTSNAHGQSPTVDLPTGTAGVPHMIGRFRVIRMLGSGGFGVVFLAIDSKLDRPVAIKVPRLEVLADPKQSTRFLREGKAAAALNHPNIVPVFEVGEIGSVAYIASAYCRGATLADWLKRRGKPVSPRAAASLVASLADAAEHAHRRGILHRDLKPTNILLELESSERDCRVDHDSGGLPGSTRASDPTSIPSDNEREDAEDIAAEEPLTEFELAAAARISDFGLAKFEDAELATHTTSTLGTPSYMPPEQADPSMGPPGPGADVYSLGAILYELISGRPPFGESTILATLDAVRNRLPVAPRKIVAEVPADLESIAVKCLEKRPQHRYGSAAALADDLERFLRREPVRARRIRGGERLLRWCRNNPAVSGLAAAVVVLAIGSTIASVRLALSRAETKAALRAAMDANDQAVSSEYQAQFALARSLQKTSIPGQRVESLEALRRAADLGQSLGLGPDDRLALRNAVIAGLAKSDLAVDRQWPISAAGDTFLATSPDGELYLHPDESRRNLLMRRIDDNSVTSRWKFHQPASRLIGARFSADGSRLGVRYEVAPGRERLQIWNLQTGIEIADVAAGGYGQSADFSRDGRRLASVAPGSRKIEVYRLPGFTLEQTIRRQQSDRTLAFAPDGLTLALHSGEMIERYELDTGRVTHRLACPSFAYVLEFSPDARRLAAACRDGRVRIYEFGERGPLGALDPIDVLEGHTAMVVGATWHPYEPLLATCSMDGKSRLWDLRSSQSLLEFDQRCTRFSRDGKWLGIHGGRMRVELSQSHRSFRQRDARVTTPADLGFYRRGKVTSEIDYWVALPNSRLVVGQSYFQAVFRDVASDSTLAEVELPGCWFRFGPRQQWLYASSQLVGFCRLPVKHRQTDGEHVISIGPPEQIHPARGGAFAIAEDRIVLTPFLSRGHVLPIVDSAKWTPSARLNVHPFTFWCDISSDGRRIATGSMKGRDVRLFDAKSGQQLRTLPSESAAPWFSPDGRKLVVAENARYTFYDTQSWQPIHKVQSVAGGIWPGSIAFSPDGRIVALELGSEIQLLSADDFKPLASFHVPSEELIESIQFGGDGRYLISGGGDQHQTHIWDLTVVRSELGEFGLDWSGPQAVPRTSALKPVRLQLDLGEIDNMRRRPSFSP